VKKKIINTLKFVAKSFVEWLLQNVYQAIFSTASLLVLFLSLKDNIWNSATNLLRMTIGEPPLNLLLWHLLLAVLLIALAFSIGFKYNVWRNKSRPYIFVEQGGFSWRVRKDKNEVKDFPFCIEHRVELIPKHIYGGYRGRDVYYCPVCGDKHTKGITRENLSDIFQIVKKKVEAKHFNYGKGF
jgi:hypothetical protein